MSGAARATSDPQAWVGQQTQAEGALTPELAGMLGAALSHAAAPAPDLRAGAPVPPLWHWAAFPEFAPMTALGADGHPALGHGLPPLPYARRMWAGGQLDWTGTLRVGEQLHRTTRILSVTDKTGGSGPMVFVRAGHTLQGAAGRVDEVQDIVYLDIPDRYRPPRAVPGPDAPGFAESVSVSEARLFRFSAATFNAHRIHYDLPYARAVEKYPALVVHGPMQACLLLEAGARHAGRAPRSFRFRGIHPMFADEDMVLAGTPDADGAGMALCSVAARSGHQCMQARAGWAQ